MKMTKADGALPSQSKGFSATGKVYQVQLKQGTYLEHKITVPTYLALELPGHPLPLGPKWPTELPAPHYHPPG